MPDYTLHYFGIGARSEAIRQILSHAKADWEDHRVEKEDWPKLKPSMPNG